NQGPMAFLAHTAELQIGAACHVEQAVAMTLRKFGDAGSLCGGKPAPARAQAHHQAIARLHRAQCRRTPALDGKAAHDASRNEARIEFRRVTQSEASSRRRKASSIAASACGFSRAMKLRISSSPRVAS